MYKMSKRIRKKERKELVLRKNGQKIKSIFPQED